LLEQLVKERVDSVRQKKRLPALVLVDHLQEAASTHAEYVARKNSISHMQRGKLRTPADRVASAGGNRNAYIGENILYTYYGKPVMPRKGQPLYIEYTYDQLAARMAVMWVGSSEHYKNIKKKAYLYTGVAIAVGAENKVYAVQVFSSLKD
jgi:uncharacterized protein YkwD